MRRFARWRGAIAGAFVLTVLGIITGQVALVLLALITLGVVVLNAAASTPTGAIRIERELDDDDPDPGVPVTVSLTVHNDSEEIVPDVRVIDSPPEAVAVVRGTPEFATTLKPGESATHTYDITSPRGRFEFGDVILHQRNLLGSISTSQSPAIAGTTSFTCRTLLDGVPLQQETIQFVGNTPTNTGGPGTEFHAVREYRPGDPINRIDWNRFARTGSLSTVEYREQRAVTVVFLVDDRHGGHVESLSSGPDSFDLTLYAASRGIIASIEDGNPTGVATLGGEWVAPGKDAYTRQRAEETLADIDPADSRVATDGGEAERLLGRLPPNAQLVVCSPVIDDGIIDIVDRFVAHDHAVSVVSPDMCTGIGEVDSTIGSRIAALQRANRLRQLRGRDVPVADWALSEPIMIELERLRRGW